MSQWVKKIQVAPSYIFRPDHFIVSKKDILALKESEEIVQAAQSEADKIIADAQVHFVKEKDRGWEEGLNSAHQEMSVRMTKLISERAIFLKESEQELINLVMECTKKIIYDFDDQSRVIGVVKNALNTLRHQKELRLSISPSMLEHVRTHLNELLALYPAVSYIDLVADARLSIDECILESKIGRVEAKIEPQLAALRKAFEHQFSLYHHAIMAEEGFDAF
jgi:type III secretion protein L